MLSKITRSFLVVCLSFLLAGEAKAGLVVASKDSPGKARMQSSVGEKEPDRPIRISALLQELQSCCLWTMSEWPMLWGSAVIFARS